MNDDYRHVAWTEEAYNLHSYEAKSSFFTPKGIPLEVHENLIVYVPRSSISKKKPDIYLFGGNFLMVTDEIKSEMDKFLGANICQFIDFSLVKKNNKNYKETLYLVNPLIIYKGDIHKTTEYEKSWIYTFLTKLVLNGKDIPPVPLFFVDDKKGMQGVTVVIQDIYERIKHSKGIDFIRVEII
jgi:hypothetical protein